MTFYFLGKSSELLPALWKAYYTCSATATISYPASLSKLPNGCQGHPRFYPSPPDRSPITKPDSNCVLRAATFIQLLAWVDIKMHKAVEAWKQKKIRINNMYTLHIFIQYGIYFWHELAYTLHYILIKLNWNICGTSAYFSFNLTCVAYLYCTLGTYLAWIKHELK